MPIGAFDSALTAPLLSDPDTAAKLDDRALAAAMVLVERGLARVQGRLGIIPVDHAEAIDSALADHAPTLEELGAGTASAGVPVIALVAELRRALPEAVRDSLHKGATSQDVVDTALMLCLSRVVGDLESRLDAVIDRLSGLADTHRRTVMAGRTRTQQAVPISFGLKAAGWLAPLKRQRRRLAAVRTDLLVLQFGGAAGSLAALGESGLAVADSLADELGLGRPVAPWHSARDGILAFGDWLSGTTDCLGKTGQDLLLLGQNEVGEIRLAAGGGSSAMPQKANPVGAEALVALARANASALSGLHHAALQEHERGGPGWTLEWITLPPMVVASAAALRVADGVLAGLHVDADRMARNLGLDTGLILAEAASVALADHLGRSVAQDLVRQACLDAPAAEQSIIDLLAERTDAPVDWNAVRDPGNYLGSADAIIDRVLRS